MLERRARPRFSLHQPVSIKMRGEINTPQLQGVTLNVSLDAVLLTAYSSISVGSDVELTLALPHEVGVSCTGKVIRVEPNPEEGKTGVVVRCDKPFDELIVNRKSSRTCD